MRGIETPITTVRRQVFEEVARIAFNSTSQSMNDDILSKWILHITVSEQ